ncbi:unnamed protein product [Phytophthora lilii]|uniref:Unnamed protein product n=1 Tax=Phytophthora lilii TaxID=2077276 RepID=A0A9W6WM23_9STRA|nr:unnamed protein product [Phytophthora lilii]
MHRAEPEVEPHCGARRGAACEDDDSLLRDMLAFVDTFPADSEQLLNENSTTNGTSGPSSTGSRVIELLDDKSGNSAPNNAVAAASQSREQRRREASRLKDRNKYLRKKVSNDFHHRLWSRLTWRRPHCSGEDPQAPSGSGSAHQGARRIREK